MIETYAIIILIVLLTAFGCYFCFTNIVRWKKMKLNTLRAKVFLDKSFLKGNFALMLVATGMGMVHITLRPLEILGIKSNGFLWDLVYEWGHIVIMLNLVFMAYLWYRILRTSSVQA